MTLLSDINIDLFAATLPALEEIRQLRDVVNSTDANRAHLADLLEEYQQTNEKPKTGAIGIAHYILGDYSQTVQSLSNADDTVVKWFYLALSYIKLVQFDKAIQAFDKAAAAGADANDIKLRKVGIYRAAKDFQTAEKALAECKIENADYCYQKGRLQEFQGEYSQAMESYEKALELDPTHNLAMFHLAYRFDMSGDEEAAIDYYKQIAMTSPVRVSALLNLAVLYEDQEKWDKAQICIERVLNSHPNHQRAAMFFEDIISSRNMFYDEEKEKRKDRKNAILETPISDFELSVRSRNCLRKMNIATLGDLLRITEAKLLSYKNFGETSLREIKAMLDAKKLKLGMAIEGEQFAEQIDQNPKTEAESGILTKPVDDLQLSVRARKCLDKLSMRTLGDVTRKTEAELLGCKNFGVTSLNEIKQSLTQMGLALRSLD
jgi:DNA-directed RNA polymerase subunit alpha